jgi:long-chain acyl-CoA synthetase
MLYNNQNAYTTALIYPNWQALKSWLASKHLSSGSEDAPQEIIQLIRSQIDQFLAGGKYADMFPHRWLPAAFAVIGEGFTEDNHMLNSTLKMVRPRITEHFQDRITDLYTPQGKNVLNELNVKTIKNMLQ